MVYSPDQVKLKYVVQFSVEGDKVKEFSPFIPTDTAEFPTPMQGEPAKSLGERFLCRLAVSVSVIASHHRYTDCLTSSPKG